MGNKDTGSLARTTYECKYHIMFTLKYRRQVIYGKIRAEIGKILRQLCEYKGVEIIEAEACRNDPNLISAGEGVGLFLFWEDNVKTQICITSRCTVTACLIC